MPDPVVKAVEQDGTVIATLTDARVRRVWWELNATGGCEFTLPTTDANADSVVPGVEIQIYYSDDPEAGPIFWGPVVRIQGGLDETTWQCADLFWYFEHRYFGRADRVNQLTNGDFESGETNWAFEGVTHSVNTDSTYVLEGTKSERLEGTTADHATFAYIGWEHPAGGHPDGDFLTASAWVFVPADDYVGGAAGDYGLVMIHRRDGNVIATDAATIGNDFTFDEWTQLEVGLGGVKEGDDIEVRLFPPHGVAYFDLVTLTFMESLSFGYPPPAIDAGDIVEGIIQYAQDRAPYDFGHGKSDLNIDVNIPSFGSIKLQRVYQFAEHRNIADALLEFVRMGIMDFLWLYSSTQRWFWVNTPRWGGTYWTTLELDTNVADFTYSWDGEQAASQVVVLGPGDGPDRPEGGAVGTDVGGVWSAEIIESAPDDITIGQLDERAEEVLKVHQYPMILEVTTLPGAGVIGDLRLGRFVPLHIERGWINIQDDDDPPYRAVRMEADLETDQAVITLNRYPT